MSLPALGQRLKDIREEIDGCRFGKKDLQEKVDGVSFVAEELFAIEKTTQGGATIIRDEDKCEYHLLLSATYFLKRDLRLSEDVRTGTIAREGYVPSAPQRLPAQDRNSQAAAPADDEIPVPLRARNVQARDSSLEAQLASADQEVAELTEKVEAGRFMLTITELTIRMAEASLAQRS